MWKVIVKWFISKGWPTIRMFIKKYEKEIVDVIFQWVESLIKKRNNTTEDQFRAKAEEAEKKASETNNADQQREYAAQADAFRQAIEILKRENQELMEELEKTKKSVEEDVEKNTDSLRAEDLFDSDSSGEISIKEKSSYLSLEAPKE